MIETKRAIKQTSEPNAYSLPVASGQSQGAAQTNKQTGDNTVFSEVTVNPYVPSIPDKTVGKTQEGPDKMTTQSKNVNPDATKTLSPDATKDNMVKPDGSADKSDSRESGDEKPAKGVFKTKTITIRRSKDPHTFKCCVLY